MNILIQLAKAITTISISKIINNAIHFMQKLQSVFVESFENPKKMKAKLAVNDNPNETNSDFFLGTLSITNPRKIVHISSDNPMNAPNTYTPFPY